MKTNDKMQEDAIKMCKDIIKELENSTDKKATIKAVFEKHSLTNSSDTAEDVIKEYNRIKTIKNIDNIDSRVFDAVSKAELIEYFGKIISVVNHGNKNIARAAKTAADEINMNPSLHGFLFEQMHVAVFNARAAAKNSNIRAFVLRPKHGMGYAKNSVDIVIKDMKSGKILRRYQAKCCSESRTAIEAILGGNYNNQRLLVPEPQANDVQKAFPGKTVTDKISYGDIESDPVSHSQAKNWQESIQNGNNVKIDLGSIDAKTYARACAEFMKMPILIDAGVHLATGIATEIISGDFDGKRFLNNTVVATAEDAFVLAASVTAIIEMAKMGKELLKDDIPYVVDITRGAYNILKTTTLMAMNKITVEAGLAQITEEIATTALIIALTKGGSVIGAKIGTLVQPGAGTAIGGAIGAIVGGLFGGIAGNFVEGKTKEALIEIFSNIGSKINEKLNIQNNLKVDNKIAVKA